MDGGEIFNFHELSDLKRQDSIRKKLYEWNATKLIPRTENSFRGESETLQGKRVKSKSNNNTYDFEGRARPPGPPKTSIHANTNQKSPKPDEAPNPIKKNKIYVIKITPTNKTQLESSLALIDERHSFEKLRTGVLFVSDYQKTDSEALENTDSIQEPYSEAYQCF
jgi:hypothetical protein